MLNSAACRSKTPRAPAEAPGCEKSGRGKGLVQGCRARYRRAGETSRKVRLGGVRSRDRSNQMEAPSIVLRRTVWRCVREARVASVDPVHAMEAICVFPAASASQVPCSSLLLR